MTIHFETDERQFIQSSYVKAIYGLKLIEELKSFKFIIEIPEGMTLVYKDLWAFQTHESRELSSFKTFPKVFATYGSIVKLYGTTEVLASPLLDFNSCRLPTIEEWSHYKKCKSV